MCAARMALTKSRVRHSVKIDNKKSKNWAKFFADHARPSKDGRSSGIPDDFGIPKIYRPS